jgi:hypothetical protein
MNKHDQSKCQSLEWKTSKGTTKPRRNFNHDDMQFCENEINLTIQKQGWKRLDVCFKWMFIHKYLLSLDLSDQTVDSIRLDFISKKIANPVFDNKEKKICKLNIMVADVMI